jgi:toxin-antitoxin system PIN domain toxin
LIALTVVDHVHHAQATEWFDADDRQLATCPITQGTFLRFLLREGTSASVAASALDQFTSQPWHVFWPDDVGYDSAMLAGVIGHRQVTDAYLAGLAKHFGGLLVTLDRALATVHPNAVTLIDT